MSPYSCAHVSRVWNTSAHQRNGHRIHKAHTDASSAKGNVVSLECDCQLRCAFQATVDARALLQHATTACRTYTIHPMRVQIAQEHGKPFKGSTVPQIKSVSLSVQMFDHQRKEGMTMARAPRHTAARVNARCAPIL